MSKAKRIISAILCILAVACVALTTAACSFDIFGDDGDSTKRDYTYKTYTDELGTNWNNHAWKTAADRSILDYISSPFVDISILDSEKGEYQWVYEMATDITDVTKDHQEDLVKYGSDLPEGKSAADVDAGYIFDISLNPNAKWENGEEITSKDYIESMKRLLDPKMKNYQAKRYCTGEAAVAGGLAYYNSESPIYDVVVPAYGASDTPDYSFDLSSADVYINLSSNDMTLAPFSFATVCNDYGYIDRSLYNTVAESVNAYGYVKITDDNREDVLSLMDQYLGAFGFSIYNGDGSVNNEFYMELLYYVTGDYSEKVEFDKVGLYALDDYTIRYVTQSYIDLNYFFESCRDNWLVYAPLYDQLKDTSGELVTTAYGTSKDTTMSYGVYKIESLQDGKQIVFVQNESWYGWGVDAEGELAYDDDGNLISFTGFWFDKDKSRQYLTTKVVVDVMDEAATKQAFLNGELSEWSPSSDDLGECALSDGLYKADRADTMSLFFNTNVYALEQMDISKGNVNSVVLSNYNFRKAFSLAIDREEFVTATPAYKPAVHLINSQYFYTTLVDNEEEEDVERIDTVYRSTEEAMRAIVNLYGVEYGTGKVYATLNEAYNSITGYNLTEAKKLMKIACDELVAAGLYTAGEDIKIKIAWAEGALTTDDNKQIALMNSYINAAVEGSGFGSVTLEAVGNIDNRYDVVPTGEYAIGCGAYATESFCPFRNFQAYMDPDNYSVCEAASYDPKVDTLTLVIDGEAITMTWQEWAKSMIGTGRYALADIEIKLEVAAKLEEAFLKTYYRIPICDITDCVMLSPQCSYYTEDYNVMYGFGGMRLLSYNYDDAEWAAFLDEQTAQTDSFAK